MQSILCNNEKCECPDDKRDRVKFMRFALHYETLLHHKGAVLCRILKCRECSRQVCTCEEIMADSTVADFLAKAYHRFCQEPIVKEWNNEEYAATQFLGLFHARDQGHIKGWFVKQLGILEEDQGNKSVVEKKKAIKI